jgi:cobalt-zinc-cadmium efflux system outer membrane protein
MKLNLNRYPHCVRALLLAFFTFANRSMARAQDNSTNAPLSLSQVKETAWRNNWDLLTAKTGIDAATAQYIMAKEFPNPTFSWSTARISTHDNSTSLGNGVLQRNYDTIAAINQLVEIAGKRHDRQVAARAGIVGARARFYDAKRILDQGVTKAYITALLAEDNVRIFNESSGYLLHEAKIAEERFKAGDISDSDMKQIEINADQFDLQARAAEATAVQARIAVEVLMGALHPKGHWTPADTLEQLVNTSTIPANPANTNAARADILAAKADLRGGAANLKLQKAIRVPDPTFLVGYEHNPPGGGDSTPPMNSAEIGVSFPLPLWNWNRGNIKAAQASVDQLKIALGKVQTQVSADIASAESEYSEAYARLARYREQIGPKSTKVRKSIAYAYEKGGASLVNLLDAERTDNDIRLATAQAMNDTASAVADLIAARHVLTEAELNPRKGQ